MLNEIVHLKISYSSPRVDANLYDCTTKKGDTLKKVPVEMNVKFSHETLDGTGHWVVNANC